MSARDARTYSRIVAGQKEKAKSSIDDSPPVRQRSRAPGSASAAGGYHMSSWACFVCHGIERGGKSDVVRRRLARDPRVRREGDKRHAIERRARVRNTHERRTWQWSSNGRGRRGFGRRRGGEACKCSPSARCRGPSRCPSMCKGDGLVFAKGLKKLSRHVGERSRAAYQSSGGGRGRRRPGGRHDNRDGAPPPC